MLTTLRSHAAYLFAVLAVLVLMLLERHVPDPAMIVLICAAGIAHVWLTRSAVRELVKLDRAKTVDATLSALNLLDHVRRPRSE